MCTLNFVFSLLVLIPTGKGCRSGAKLDLMIMIAVGFGISEALTIMGGAKMVASVRILVFFDSAPRLELLLPLWFQVPFVSLYQPLT